MIIPLLLSFFIVIPRRYVPTTVRVFFLDSRSITGGFWGESRLLAMRPKYGVRIPKCSHTQRLPEIAVLRDIFSSGVLLRETLGSFVTQETFRSLRESIMTTKLFPTNLESFFHDGYLNSGFIFLKISFVENLFPNTLIFLPGKLIKTKLQLVKGLAIEILCEKVDTRCRNDDTFPSIYYYFKLIFLSVSTYRKLLLNNVFAKRYHWLLRASIYATFGILIKFVT